MSSIPNAAMPHAMTMPSAAMAGDEGSRSRQVDRALARLRDVPNLAWLAGAAAIGAAAVAGIARRVRGRAAPARPAKRARVTRKVGRRKAAAA